MAKYEDYTPGTDSGKSRGKSQESSQDASQFAQATTASPEQGEILSFDLTNAPVRASFISTAFGTRIALPAGTAIDKVFIKFGILYLLQPDGSVIVIEGGATFYPTLVFAPGVTITAEQLEAVLENAREGVPTAGPDVGGPTSGGGNFSVDPGGIGFVVDLTDLLESANIPDFVVPIVFDNNFEELLNGFAEGLPSIGAPDPGFVEEDDLQTGINEDMSVDAHMFMGSLAVNFGPDGPGTIRFDPALTAPAGLTSQGEQLTYVIDASGTLLTAQTAQGRQVFTVEIDPAAPGGKYTFTLIGPLDHLPGPGASGLAEENLHDLLFPFVVADSNGNAVQGQFTVSAQDDIPGRVGKMVMATIDEADFHDSIVLTDIGAIVQANGAILQPDGKIVVAGTSGDFALLRYNADFSRDLSFGTNGLVATDIGLSDWLSSVALQSDGKIVVAGFTNISTFYAVALARYNADGSLDTSFGTGGIVTTDITGSDRGTTVIVQPDGKIVVAGESDGFLYALFRYNTDGSLDATFGTGGHVTTFLGGNLFDLAYAITLQPDGKIVVAGSKGGFTNVDIVLVRYNADGLLDTSFGTGGIVTTDINSTDIGSAVIVQPDGKIVVAGVSSGEFVLARYNTDGSLDTGFGTGGIVGTDISNTDIGSAVIVQPDGKIVVAGSSGGDFALARYNADGSLDTSFGTGGIVGTDIGSTDRVSAVILQPDGKIVVAGSSGGDFALARYNADGSLDSSFISASLDLTPLVDFGADGPAATDAFALKDVTEGGTLMPQVFDKDGNALTSGGVPVVFSQFTDNGTESSLTATANGATVFILSQTDAGDSRFDLLGPVDHVAPQLATVLGTVPVTLSTTLADLGLADTTSFGITINPGLGNGPLGFQVEPGDSIGDLIAEINTRLGADVTASISDAGTLLIESNDFVTSFALVLPGGPVNPLPLLGFETGVFDPVANQDILEIDFSGLIAATDFDGDTIMLGDGQYLVKINDGLPHAVPGAMAMATLDEDNVGVSNGTGVVITNIGIKDVGRSVTVQPDGKILVAGLTGDTPILDFALVRYNADLSLDPTFGPDGTGIVTYDLGVEDQGQDVVLQPDGKIVVAGESDGNVTLLRYDLNGSLDTSFGINGVVTTDLGSDDSGQGIVLQSDGKFVVTGFSNGDAALLRFNSDGSLDTSFGTGGIVIDDLGSIDEFYDVALQPDGKIVAAGWSGDNFALVRYDAVGLRDATFGANGVVTTDFGSADIGFGVILQSDGKIVVAGENGLGTLGSEIALARYNPDGSLDTSFGTGGKVLTNVLRAFDSTEIAEDIALQPDGKILIAGWWLHSGLGFAVVRYNPDGSLDTSFGTGGIVADNVGFFGYGFVLQPDGKIVVVGTTGDGGRDLVMVRYNSDGSLDTGFVSTTLDLSPLVDFGADGAAAGGGFALDDVTLGGTLTPAVLDGGGNALLSNGDAVVFSGFTDAGGMTTLTATANGVTVFTLALTGKGRATLTLLEELDHPQGVNLLQIDVSALVIATDFDGDAVALPDGSVLFKVNESGPPEVSISNGTTSAALANVSAPVLAAVTEDPGDTFAFFQVALSRTTGEDITVDLLAQSDDSGASSVGGDQHGAVAGIDFEDMDFEFSTDGGATWMAGGGANGTQVTISTGETSILVRVQITDDVTPEVLEAFRLSIDSVVTGSAVIATGDAPDGGFGATGEAQIISDELDTLPIIDAVTTLNYSAPNNILYQGAPVTTLSRVRFEDADGDGLATATFRATNVPQGLTDTWVIATGALAAFSLTADFSIANEVSITGNISDINAFLEAENLAWNPGGPIPVGSDIPASGPQDRTIEVTLDTNPADNDGPEATETIDLVFVESQAIEVISDFSLVNYADTTIVGTGSSEFVFTSWSHSAPLEVVVGGGVLVAPTTYDSGEMTISDIDIASLVFTPEQLEELLVDPTFRADLSAVLDLATPDAVGDFSASSWNAIVTGFETGLLILGGATIADLFGTGFNVTSFGPLSSSILGFGDSATANDDLYIGSDLNPDAYNEIAGLFGGNDIILGLGGNDNIFGGDGNDLILGGDGNDGIGGGLDFDLLSGGRGSDTFFFADIPTGGTDAPDQVVDYSFVEGDVIDLSGLLDAVFDPGIHDRSDFARIQQTGDDITVQVDTDGQGAGTSFQTVAALSGYGSSGLDPVALAFEGETTTEVI